MSTVRDAEQAVISAMLMDQAAIPRARRLLSVQAFQEPAHRSFVDAIYKLHSDGITADPLTLAARMEELGTLEPSGGKDYIIFLIDAVPTAANVEYHARIVRGAADRRRAMSLLTIAKDKLGNPLADPREVVRDLQTALLPIAIESDERGYRELTGIDIEAFLSELDERAERTRAGLTPGFPSGYKAIDNETQGFRPGDLVILGGVPKSMKSQVVLNIAINAAVRGDVVGVVSAEMTFSTLLQRLIASVALVPLGVMAKGILTDDERNRIRREGNKLSGRIIVDDEGLPELADVIVRATDLKARRPEMQLLIVDYVQLIQSKLAGRRGDEEISAVTKALKKLGKRLELTILAPAQANYKEIDARADKRPELRDFQGASGMAQDADLAGLIYNERQYDSSAQPILEIAWRASRYTAQFTSYLKYDPKTLAIMDI